MIKEFFGGLLAGTPFQLLRKMYGEIKCHTWQRKLSRYQYSLE